MVKFLEKSHTYLNEDGIIIPSVTQLLAWKFGSGYDNVPKEILEAKAKYGTRIHKVVEDYCVKGYADAKNPIEAMSLAAYIEMSKSLPNVVGNEMLVDYEGRLAGTLDLLYEDGNIGDLKTYATLGKNEIFKTTWQICLYHFCLHGRDMDKYNKNHLLHLPKSMSFSHTEIGLDHPFEECLALLEEWEAAHA